MHGGILSDDMGLVREDVIWREDVSAPSQIQMRHGRFNNQNLFDHNDVNVSFLKFLHDISNENEENNTNYGVS